MKKTTLALIAVIGFSAAALTPVHAEDCCSKDAKKEKSDEKKESKEKK